MGVFREEMKDILMFLITLFGIVFIAFYVSSCVGRLVEEGLARSTSLIHQVIYVLNIKQIKNTEELQSEICNVFLIHKLNCKIMHNILEKKRHKYESPDSANSSSLNLHTDVLVDKSTKKVNNKRDNTTYYTSDDHNQSFYDLHEAEEICKICQTEEYSYSNFLEVYLKQIKHVIKYNLEKYNTSEMQFYVLLKLIIIEQIEKEKVVKLIYKMKMAIDKVTKVKNSLYWNLLIFNKYIKKRNPESIVKKFLIMKKYDETCVIMKKSIELVDELYVIFDTHVEKEIYDISKKINNFRKEVYDNINMFVRMKNFYIENYTLIIIKYIYENLYNASLRGANITDTMIDLEDVMNYHFNYDNIIKINFNIEDNRLTILKASKDLLDFGSKNFEDMIPRRFKKLAKKKFIKLVKENNSDKFMFEFIIQKSLDDLYIYYIKIECMVSLSMDLKELLIVGEYNISKEEIIMFEENETGGEILVNFSKNLNKILFIPMSFLSNLKNCKIYFTFDMIFERIIYHKKELTKILNKKKDVMNFYKIDYEKYYQNYQQSIAKSNLLDNIDENNSTNNEIQDEIKLSEELKSLAYNKTIASVSLTSKQTIKLGPKIYNIYSVRKFDYKQIMMEDTIDDETYINNLERLEYENLLSHSNSSSSAINTRTSSIISQSRVNNEKFNNNENKNLLELNQITIATSILSFIFVIYCFVFLALGMINKDKINDSFKIRNTFNDMRTNYYDMSSSLLNNFELYKYNSTTITNNREAFLKRLIDNKNITLDFDKFIKAEIQIKVDILQKSINFFQQSVISSHYKESVDFIFDETTDYLRISQISGALTLYKNKNLFFTSLKMIINNAQIIIDNDKLAVYIYILTLENGEVNFKNIFDTNLSNVQIYAYEIILNYLQIYNNFEKLGVLLSDMHLLNINDIFSQTFYLTFILMGLHVSLIFLCCCIIRYLNRIINRNAIIINDLFISNNIRYMRTKLAIFRNLNELYREDPTKLLSRFKSIRQNFLLQKEFKNGEVYQKDTENRINISNIIQIKKAKYNIDNMILLKPIFMLITMLFFFYYTFNTFFYFILNTSKNELTFSSKMSENNKQIYSSILNNLNLLQVMIFTNISDLELNKYINNNYDDTGYVMKNNYLVMKQTFQMYSEDTISSKYGIMPDYQTKLNDCNYIYANLNDTIYYNIQNTVDFVNVDLEKSLINICKMYSVMKNNNIKFITAELNYITKDLLFRYEYSRLDYSKMKDIYDDITRYDLYILITIVLRPIQTYINNNLNSISVTISEANYLTVTIIYLTFNILIDVVLFYFINRYIVKQVLNINNDLSTFINVIKK